MKDFCENPYIFINTGLKTDKGAIKYKIISSKGYSPTLERELKDNKSDYVLIPCGQCYYCKMSYQRQWLQRMHCESHYHNKAWFITLTYAHSPRFLKKDDLQKFMKRLRFYFYKNFGLKNIVYFAAGEYGSLFNRPHYHLIIFDLPILDLEVASMNTHTSETIRKLWNKGIVQVDQADIGSFSYVAGYSAKKTPNDNLAYIKFMKKFPRKIRPFCVMSKKIGMSYFMDNYKDIYKSDSVIISNHKNTYYSTPCRYFDNMLKRLDPNKYQSIKAERLNNIEFNNLNKFNLNDKELLNYYRLHADVHHSKVKAKRYSI